MLIVTEHLASVSLFLMPNFKDKDGNSLAVHGEDSTLSLLRAWVQSLVGELRSHKLRGTVPPKKPV